MVRAGARFAPSPLSTIAALARVPRPHLWNFVPESHTSSRPDPIRAEMHSHRVRFGEAGAVTDIFSRQFPILFSSRKSTRHLADSIQRVDVVAVCREYDQLRKRAPSRSARNKRYFVGHDGRPQAKYPASPSEKHLAIALWRLKAQWPRAGGGWLRLLDYQFPLKASRSDTGLGEVDLLGVTDQGRLVVIELKVRRKDGSRGDTPLLALMEGLRYAAVVHANHGAIAAEARERVRDPRVRGAANRAAPRTRGLVARVVQHGR